MTTIHLSKLTINSNNDIVNQLNKKLRVKVHQHSLEKTSAVAN